MIDTVYWEGAAVNYDEITHIEYRVQAEPGNRTLGLGGFRLLLGQFHNEEFGDYTRYSYADCDSCVVLNVGEDVQP